MLVVDFMTQEQCERLIELADNHGNWDSLKYDKFPAQEIRLKELGLWEELETKWNRVYCSYSRKVLETYTNVWTRDAFVMKYNLETQKIYLYILMQV